jgi:hypothetical protein
MKFATLFNAKGNVMMKKDLKITTAIAGALLAGACQQQPDEWTAQRDTAVCTDRQGHRVPDANCQRQSYASHGGGGNAFLWYYLGRNSAVPYYGEQVRGGTFSRAPGRSYFQAPTGSSMTRTAAISRGGFGSSAHSFGGFGE